MDISTLLKPIAGDNPGGADSRYEPEYTRMLEEVEKLNSISHSQECRWEVVEEQAMLVLQHKAKDFQAASYLAYALYRQHGLEGIADGAALLAGLVTTYWETGFPVLRRVRGRINAMAWWQERMELALDSLAADSEARFDPDLLTALTDNLQALDNAIAEQLPDFPSLRPLMDRARRLMPMENAVPAGEAPVQGAGAAQGIQDAQNAQPVQDAQAAPQPAETADSPRQAPGQAVPSAPQPREVIPQAPQPQAAQPARPAVEAPRLAAPAALSDNAEHNRREFLRYAGDFAEALLGEDPLSPLAWQSLCLARLGMIANLPPSEGGRTPLPPPDESERKALEQLGAAGMHAEALTALRNSWGSHLFWLDALRMLSASLQALHSPAADVLALETLAFVRRLPGVERAAFSDGTPFADAATCAWLAEIAGTGSSRPPQDATQDRIAKARALFAQNQQAEALDMLEPGPAADSRDWLALRLEQVRMLMRCQAFAPALSLARDLLEKADALQTQRWDRELMLDICAVSRTCLAQIEANDAESAARTAQQQQELLVRMALLKPSSVVQQR